MAQNRKADAMKIWIPAGALITLLIVLLIILSQSKIAPQNQTVEILPHNSYDKTIIIVMDIDYEPFSFIDADGNHNGFDVELINAAANIMEVNVEIRMMDWLNCNETIKRGEADIIAGLPYIPEGYEGVIFSRAFINDSFVSFGRENFHLLNHLNDKRLAHIYLGGSIQNFLEPYYLMENTAFYLTYTEALQSVIDGDNDYAIARFSVGRRILAELGETEVRAVGPVLFNSSKCLGIAESSAHLFEPLNAALTELLNDGTVNSLKNKWMGNYVEVISFNDFLTAYSNVLFSAAIFLIIIVSLVLLYLYRLKYQNRLAENELELAQSRISIMLSQIQPHFLYNSLVVIRQLCGIDPKLAEETVVEFSEYLRGNLESLTQKKLIPFEQELHHVRTYLSIEKKRFGDELNVVYDINYEDFKLPALTLQPIVENAVHHGVTKKESGGTVTIKTGQTEKEAVITVTDDGIGFDPENPPKKDNKSHIGLENVTSRLAAMCGGTLTVNSKPGAGTTAVITIPFMTLT